MVWTIYDGFNDCMEMETNTKSELPNYGIVGFGFSDGNQLVPLMYLGFCGSSPLGLAHDGLVISFAIWGLSWLYTEDNGGDLQNGKVRFAWGFLACYFILFETYIISMLLNRGFVVGYRCRGMMKKSNMARVLPRF